jgi:hypothetical protein
MSSHPRALVCALVALATVGLASFALAATAGPVQISKRIMDVGVHSSASS